MDDAAVAALYENPEAFGVLTDPRQRSLARAMVRQAEAEAAADMHKKLFDQESFRTLFS